MPINVFISYAHRDRKLRDELAAHLSNLRNQHVIHDWFDGDILPGIEWEQDILDHLSTARIILLLISAYFMNSTFCTSVELQQAIVRHEAHVIPIILRPTDWKDAPFAKLQVLPTNGKPVSKWPTHHDAFEDVVKGIRRAIEDLNARGSPKPPVSPLLATGPISMDVGQVPIWNVPFRRNPFFTGRDTVLHTLHQALTRQRTAVLTQVQTQAISGLGGIGKTQTAIEYAYRYQDEYAAVLWAKADSREALSSDFVAIAGVLQLPEKDAQDQSLTINAVKQWLERSTDWLLILDNADDLSIAQQFLPTSGKGHILLTTRARPMGKIARRVELDTMEPEEGALLLLRRAGILPPDAPLAAASAVDRAHALQLVAALGGLPLALDQAGAYIEETGSALSRYLELYQTRRQALLRRRSKLPTDHPEPVATTWSLSFQQVEQANPAAAELLRFCAFLHPDAIPEELIAASAPDLGVVLEPVARDPLQLDEAIAELQRFSLVRRDPGHKNLSIHRLVQAVLRDAMGLEATQQWTSRAVQAVNAAFPDVEFTQWSVCELCLPHALICITWVEHGNIPVPEAARLLTQAGLYLKERGLYTEAEPPLQCALAIRERQLGAQHPDTAASLNNLALLYEKQGKWIQAEPLFQRALAIREQQLGAQHPDTAASLHGLARLYMLHGKDAQAEPLFQRALAIREQQLGAQHPDTAASLHELALLYGSQGKYTEAESLYQRALAIREQQLGAQHPATVASLHDLARLYGGQGKYTEAESLLQRALAIREQQLGPEHPDTAGSLFGLAWLYAWQDKYAEAEPLFQRALAIDEKALGPEHPYTANCLGGLAWLYAEQGKYTEAQPLLQRALTIQQRLGALHLTTVASLRDLAWLYARQDKYAEAEPLLQRALAIREQQLGPEHPDTAASLRDLAWLYLSQGKYEQAEPLFQRALAIYEQAVGPDHPNTASILNNLANLYADQGKYEQAEPLYQRALAIKEKVLGPDHPDTAMTLNNLALLYYDQGKYEQAEPLYQRALAINERTLGPDHPETMKVRENYTNLLQKMKQKAE